MSISSRLSILVVLCTIVASLSLAVPFRVDASHSNVSFSIRHIYTKVNGRFTKFKGTIEFEQKTPDKIAVDFSVETASVNTDNERRDNDLRGESFFMSDSFPTMTFKSTKSYKKGKGLFVEGNLTIRGTTRSIVVPFEVLGVGGEPGKLVAGFESTFKINRKDYGITWNRAADQGGLLLGDEVEIHIGVEAKFFLE